MSYVGSNYQSLKYRRFTSTGSKDIGIIEKIICDDCTTPLHKDLLKLKLVSSSRSSNIITGLPELRLQDFQKINLSKYLWVHLEGRNRENLLQILQFLRDKEQVKFSVEVEKVGRGFEDFIPFPDLVLISKVK